MIDGTDQIANHFEALASTQGVQFCAPTDAVTNWLPEGYRLVVDPDHLIQSTDCIMPSLGNDWRVVSSVNAGARVGRRARDAGPDVIYVATRKLE